MLITADQILCHLVGDYILQPDRHARLKTKYTLVAGGHAFLYAIPFQFLGISLWALYGIILSHFVIDRWRLARYVVWAKNVVLGLEYTPWRDCAATGYPPDRPAWLTVWLLIIADNTLHLLANGAALRWL